MGKIVILDGYTANSGDLDWSGIDSLGDVTHYDRTPPQLIVERSLEAEILIINKTVLTSSVIEALPNLKYVGLFSTGYNVVDLDACNKRGIAVCNVPSYSTDSVAQMVMAHILAYTNRVELHSNQVNEGQWSRCKDFSYTATPQIELSGKTLGVIGLGGIGERVTILAKAFGMETIAYTPHPEGKVNPAGAQFLNFEEVLEKSDFLSLHLPLFPETENLIDQKALQKMKKTAFLINTSRGPIVNEQDLANALKEGEIAGAGLDVTSTEPIPANSPLLEAPNCFITPHIAWATKEARGRLLKVVEENIKAYFSGKIQNCVNLK